MLLWAAGALAGIAPLAQGGLVISQLGNQDFADGASPVLASQIHDAGIGEPAPFDGEQFGDDRSSALGRFEYTHTYDLAGQTPRSAALTVGLLDIDSFPGDARGSVRWYLNGIEQPDGLLIGISDPTATSSAEVVTLPVPLDLLTNGRLTVQFQALLPVGKRKGTGNAIGADFSALSIDTTGAINPSPPSIPEPTPGPSPDPGPTPHPTPVAVPPAGVAGFQLLGLLGVAAAARRLRKGLLMKSNPR